MSSEQPMQALILAGGKGTRLQPYTTVLPKPLIPIGEYPILEVILRQLKASGVAEVILAVGYLSHLFKAFFQDGSRYGLTIEYSYETEPLGTAGPIGLAIDRLHDDFLVMNGDLLTTMKYANLFQYHREMKADATIGLFPREVNIDFGVIERDAECKLLKYIEKPTYRFEVSMGINVLNAAAIRPYLIPGRHLDLPDLLTRLCNDGRRVLCYSESCLWLDIGRIDDYRKAIETFDAMRADFLGPSS